MKRTIISLQIRSVASRRFLYKQLRDALSHPSHKTHLSTLRLDPAMLLCSESQAPGVQLEDVRRCIRSAYTRLVLEVHPDLCKDEDATQRFQKLSRSYHALLTVVRKQTHRLSFPRDEEQEEVSHVNDEEEEERISQDSNRFRKRYGDVHVSWFSLATSARQQANRYCRIVDLSDCLAKMWSGAKRNEKQSGDARTPQYMGYGRLLVRACDYRNPETEDTMRKLIHRAPHLVVQVQRIRSSVYRDVSFPVMPHPMVLLGFIAISSADHLCQHGTAKVEVPLEEEHLEHAIMTHQSNDTPTPRLISDFIMYDMPLHTCSTDENRDNVRNVAEVFAQLEQNTVQYHKLLQETAHLTTTLVDIMKLNETLLGVDMKEHSDHSDLFTIPLSVSGISPYNIHMSLTEAQAILSAFRNFVHRVVADHSSHIDAPKKDRESSIGIDPDHVSEDQDVDSTSTSTFSRVLGNGCLVRSVTLHVGRETFVPSWNKNDESGEKDGATERREDMPKIQQQQQQPAMQLMLNRRKAFNAESEHFASGTTVCVRIDPHAPQLSGASFVITIALPSLPSLASASTTLDMDTFDLLVLAARKVQRRHKIRHECLNVIRALKKEGNMPASVWGKFTRIFGLEPEEHTRFWNLVNEVYQAGRAQQRDGSINKEESSFVSSFDCVALEAYSSYGTNVFHVRNRGKTSENPIWIANPKGDGHIAWLDPMIDLNDAAAFRSWLHVVTLSSCLYDTAQQIALRDHLPRCVYDGSVTMERALHFVQTLSTAVACCKTLRQLDVVIRVVHHVRPALMTGMMDEAESIQKLYSRQGTMDSDSVSKEPLGAGLFEINAFGEIHVPWNATTAELIHELPDNELQIHLKDTSHS